MRWGALVTAVMCSLVGLSQADPAAAAIKRLTRIPAERLDLALATLAQDRNLQVIYQSEVVGDRQAQGVTGEFTPEEVLSQLLQGSGLTYRYLNESTVTIVPLSAAEASVGKRGEANDATRATREHGSDPKEGRSFWDRFRLAQVDQRGVATDGSIEPAKDGAARQSDKSPKGLEEVTVTAQKRAERLQDVPIAVSAFSATDLTASGVTSNTDLGMVVPGLMSVAQFGYFQPHLRGVGTTAPSSSVESPVATYVDGVYYGSQTGSLFQLAGIESIEVDKGPQGTLFGRNATGGLIQISTRDPQQAFSADASVTGGDYRTFGTSDYVTGGFSDNVAANLSLFYQNQGQGYGVNQFNGLPVNKAEDLAVRQKWLFSPTDRDTILVAFDYEFDHSLPVFIPAPGTTPLGGPPYTGPRQGANGYYQPVNDEKQGGVSVKVDHDYGFATLQSLTAFQRSSLTSYFDGTLVADPTYAFNIGLVDRHTQFTQEINLKSAADSALNWVGGVFLYRSDAQYDPVTLNGGLLQVFYPGMQQYITYSDATSYSGAFYAQASKEVARATTLTLGARYTWEEKYFNESQSALYPDSPLVSFGSVNDATQIYKKPTWRVSIDHKFTPDVLGYVSYNRGYKSGGFNDQLLPVLTYEPETLDSYEIGAKTASPNRRLQVNAAAFFYRYSNIQAVAYPQGSELIYNGAQAHIYGADLDIKAIPFENFTISSAFEWLHATFTSFPSAQFSTPASGGGTLVSTFDATGYHLPLAPDWTFDFSPLYTIALGDKGNLSMSATYSYNDGYFYEPDNRLRQHAYGLVNAAMAWDSPGNSYTVRLWGKNLTDAQVTTAQYTQNQGDYAVYAPPLTWGVTVSYKFK